MLEIECLRPITKRVRTDITAVKTSSGTSVWRRDQSLTPQRILDHISGKQLRGVCPIKEGESTTKLALLDFDSHKGETSWDEMTAVVQKVYDAAAEQGIYFEGFVSSGGSGVHLIAIWDRPQDAYSVRMALTNILTTCGYKNGAGGVAKKEIEIFPKQDSVPMGGCGNQFILPFSPKGQPIGELTWTASSPVPVLEKLTAKEKSYVFLDSTDERAEVLSALSYINPNISYPDWVNIGMALQDKFGDAGFGLWDSWSSAGADYKAHEMYKKWRTFKNDGGITIATLFDHARLSGWRPDPVEETGGDTSMADGFIEKAIKKMRGSEEAKRKITLPNIQPLKLDFHPEKIEGIIGETVRYILQDSWQPQPFVALLNVLAFAGAVFGRRYASPLNTRTNIYLVCVADTGAGKDASRKKINVLAEAAGLGEFVGSNAVRSDSGIARSLSVNPCQVLQLDEYGKFLQALSDPKASPHHKALVRLFMQLYSDSSGVYKHGEYADVNNKQIVIYNPNLCIFGTTTEKDYIKALHKDAIESGELNRVIAIKVEPVERVRINRMLKASQDLIDAWARYSTDGILNSGSMSIEPIIVEWGDCDDLQWEIAKEQDAIGRDNPQTAALWNRRHENIIKIAMILAIARNKIKPEFRARDFEVAKYVVDSAILYMCNLIENNLAESTYERDFIEVITYIRKTPQGKISRTDLFRRFRKFKRRDLDDLITSMIEQNIICAQKESSQSANKGVITYAIVEDFV